VFVPIFLVILAPSKIELLQKGAISECKHEDNEFISYIFLVKKKGGKFQPVINLKDRCATVLILQVFEFNISAHDIRIFSTFSSGK
jgi:hypothetical protein